MEMPVWMIIMFQWIRRITLVLKLIMVSYLLVLTVLSLFSVQFLFKPIPFYLQSLYIIMFINIIWKIVF